MTKGPGLGAEGLQEQGKALPVSSPWAPTKLPLCNPPNHFNLLLGHGAALWKAHTYDNSHLLPPDPTQMALHTVSSLSDEKIQRQTETHNFPHSRPDPLTHL